MTVRAANSEIDLNLRKINIIQSVSSTENESIIDALEEVLRLKRIEEYEKKLATPKSREEYQKELSEADESIERGEGISLEDLIKEFEEKEGKSIFED